MKKIQILISFLAKKTVLGPKWYFISFGKWQKATTKSEVQPNLIYAKGPLGSLQQPQYKLFSFEN